MDRRKLNGDFKPDVENISSDIINLDRLIRQYPGEDVIPQFKKLQLQYPYYRAVRGDGNCFYRAMAFLFNHVFQDIPNVCKKYPLQFQGQSFQFQLRKIYEKFLQPLKDIQNTQRETELIYFFNNSIIFDTVLILYFRSLNYLFIQRNPADFKDYITNKQSIQRIKMFQQDSQGIQYLSMAKALNVTIVFKITDKYDLKTENYNQQLGTERHQFFYRPGHFDILYHKNSSYLKKFTRKNQSYKSHYDNNNYSIYRRNQQQMKSRISNQNNSKVQPFLRQSNQSKRFPSIPSSIRRPQIFQSNDQSTTIYSDYKQNKQINYYQLNNQNSFKKQQKQSPFQKISNLRKDSSAISNRQQKQNVIKDNNLSKYKIQNKNVNRQKLKQSNAFTDSKIQLQNYNAWSTSGQSENSRKFKQIAIIITFIIFFIILAIRF